MQKGHEQGALSPFLVSLHLPTLYGGSDQTFPGILCLIYLEGSWKRWFCKVSLFRFEEQGKLKSLCDTEEERKIFSVF
jgi:hypothetical protein